MVAVVSAVGREALAVDLVADQEALEVDLEAGEDVVLEVASSAWSRTSPCRTN